MTASTWVEVGLIAVTLGGLAVTCLVDPKGLVEAERLREMPPPDPSTKLNINHIPGKDYLS